jgi:dolichol-phosphate mannosyltransferase
MLRAYDAHALLVRQYVVQGLRYILVYARDKNEFVRFSLNYQKEKSQVRIDLQASHSRDFVLLGKKPREVMASMVERNRFFQGDILWLGFPIKFIPYHRNKRVHGKSQWTLFKKIKYFIDGFLSTSYLSIRLMSLLGASVAAIGFAYAALIVFLKIVYDISPKGIAPIMVLILVLGGITMLMLGIIGEYVWRIYDETRGRPLYIINERHAALGEAGDGSHRSA